MGQARSAPRRVKELSKRTGHRIQAVSITDSKIIYTCTTCLSQWNVWCGAVEGASKAPCGRALRTLSLRMKRKWWSGAKADMQRKLLQTWRLSHQESATLHATPDRVGRKRKSEGRRRKCWVRDLTQEGIHPHPGPLDLWTVNVQGAAHISDPSRAGGG